MVGSGIKDVASRIAWLLERIKELLVKMESTTWD